MYGVTSTPRDADATAHVIGDATADAITSHGGATKAAPFDPDAGLEEAVKAAQRREELESEAEEQRPREGLPRYLAIALALAATWIIIQAMQGLGSIVAPALLALNLVIVAHPIKSSLTKLKVPEPIGAVLAGLLVLALLVAFFWAIGWAIASLVTELPQYQTQFNELYTSSLEQLSKLGLDEGKLAQQLQNVSPSSILGYASTIATSVQSMLSLLAVIVMVVFFLTMDMIGFSRRMQILAVPHPRLAAAMASFASGVRNYWIVSTVFGIICAALDYVALKALSVPLAEVWAVLAFVTNYLPNVGFVVGLIPAALMGALDEGWGTAGLVVVAYCVINFVIQSMIQPKFAGDAVGITPTVSFLSLLFWAWTLGALGALIALPTTLLFKALFIDADPRSRWANALIASNPDTALSDSTRESFNQDTEVQASAHARSAADVRTTGGFNPPLVQGDSGDPSDSRGPSDRHTDQ